MGAEAVGDDETASVDTDPDAKAVGDADCRIRRVVGERLGEPSAQLAAVFIASRGRWG
jgi:hypothetical protein